MQPPAFPDNESERLAALLQSQLLDSPAEQRFDRITALVKTLFHCDIVLISLVDGQRQWFKSKQGTEVCETERSISFCGHTILDNSIMLVPDALQDPRFAENPLVKSAPYIRFYAGVPLRSPDGYNLGTLCLIDSESRSLDLKQQQMLQQFAHMIESEILQSFTLQQNIELDDKLKDVLAAEDKLTAIIETNQLATWKYNVKTGATIFNQRWAELVGYNLAELQPTTINTWLSLLHPDDYLRSTEAMAEHFAQQTDFYDCEVRIRHSSGNWVWVRESGKVITRDQEQDPVLVFGTLEDISAQKQQQHSLQLQQKLTGFQASILSSKQIVSADQASWAYFCQQIAEALNVDRVSIWLQQEASSELSCHYLQQNNKNTKSEDVRFSKDKYPHYFAQLERNTLLAVSDAKHCLDTAELADSYLKPEKIVSKMDCIIRADTGVVGILAVETIGQQRQWHSEEQRFILTMTSIARTILSFLELKQLNDAYQHTHTLLARTSELATIGLWELSLPSFDIHWDKVTRHIHEVSPDYLPDAKSAIQFYVQGENRERIKQLLEQTISNNVSFDDSFEIITAKGTRKWVRAVGEADFSQGECRRVYGLFQDITDARQSYQALQQANKRLSLTQERLDIACQNARLGFWQAWPETGELWWSSVVYQIFGLDEATTTPSIALFEQAIHPDDFHLLKASEQKAQLSGVHDIVHRIIMANGEVRWVHELAKLVPQSDKNLPTLVGSVQDITAKVIAEQAHYRLTSLLQTVLDAASEVSIIAIDTSGIIQLANKGAVSMLGYQADELIQQQSLTILHDQVEVATRAAELTQQYGESVLGVDVFTIEARRYGYERRRWIYQCKNGSELLVQVIVTPMRDEQDNITGYLCLGHDITMQEQMTFELNQFFNLSQSLLCISSPTGYFVRVNKAFNQVLGHSEADLLSQPILHFIHPEDMTKTQVELANIEQGKVSANFTNRLRHKDGHYVSVEWFTAIDPDSGKLYSAAQDITERLKLEQLKSEFISTVSHELRTPITSISGALGLVLSGVVGQVAEESKQLLNIASSNCKRLANLINDLLDIEKLHAGKMQVELATHFLLPLLTRAIDENQTYSIKQALQLSLQLPPEAEHWQVRVDEFRFLQIMANLISNAIKFSPENSEVIISATMQQSMLVVAVTDFGSGIAEHYKSQIFEKFSQADASDAREKGGTGLGLALSKQLAEAMSGTISFDSTEGEGSTFYVHFPAVNRQ